MSLPEPETAQERAYDRYRAAYVKWESRNAIFDDAVRAEGWHLEEARHARKAMHAAGRKHDARPDDPAVQEVFNDACERDEIACAVYRAAAATCKIAALRLDAAEARLDAALADLESAQVRLH
jgi:hypothetical protein